MDYAVALKKLYDDETLRDKCEKEGLRFTRDIHNYRILSRAFLRQIMADEFEGNYPGSAHP
jgi:hypothetical protein